MSDTVGLAELGVSRGWHIVTLRGIWRPDNQRVGSSPDPALTDRDHGKEVV